VIDAVDRGVYMLKKRPKNNRRIILVVSETRDEGSETRLKEALIDVNIENVQVYFVDISQLAVRLTEKPDIRPEYIDPTTMNAPSGFRIRRRRRNRTTGWKTGSSLSRF